MNYLYYIILLSNFIYFLIIEILIKMDYISQITILFLFIISFCIRKSNNIEIKLSNTDNEDDYYYIDILNETEKSQKFGNYLEIVIINNLNKTNIHQNKSYEKNQFLTYEVIPNYGKINVSICKNKFCVPSNGDDIIIKDYKSYFYTIEKHDDKKNLVVQCIEGVQDDIESKCIVKVNVYTKKDVIYINETDNNDILLYKYISKNNENKYSLKGNYSLYISLFSGNISLNSEIIPVNYPFYFDIINNSKNIIIMANEDSFYSINFNNYKKNIENSFIIGSYYLLNTNTTIKLIDNFYYYGQKEYPYYLGIYQENKNKTKIKENYNDYEFHQSITSSNDDFELNVIYNNTNCYASIYQIDDITGISLVNNIPQSFQFNNTFKNVNFSYPHIQKKHDLIISSDLNKNDIYNITIYLNDKKNENLIYKLKGCDKIILSSDIIMENCDKFLLICKVLLFIEPENIDSKLTITVNSILRKKSIIILSLLFICGGGLLIMIFLVLFNMIKMIRKKENLIEKIRTTYFEKEMIRNEEEDNESLE